jgi:hypothetical protein
MIDLWPEEDSPAFRLGGVFDEATHPRKTGQQVVDECLELAAAIRAGRRPVPEVLQRLEREEALEQFMSNNPGCAWLRERRPVGRLEEVAEHWRGCGTCQTEARLERQARRRSEPQGR